MELDDHSPAAAGGDHAIDFPRMAAQKKAAAAAKQQAQRKPAAAHDSDDDDDPYTDPAPASASSSHPHASTAGDAFYDLFAALERNIAQGSAMLRASLQFMKLIKQYPDRAGPLKDEL